MLKLHFEKVGSDNTKSLIFLHGFMGRGENFKQLAQDLSSEFDCYLIDLPGHGKSAQALKDFKSFDELVLHLHEWAKTLTSPHLFGYSMGGRIAMGLLSMPFSPIIKGIIESANPGIQNKNEASKRALQDEFLLRNVTDIEAFRRFLNEWYRKDLFGNFIESSQYNDHITDILENQDFEKLSDAIKAYSVGKQPNLWDKIKSPIMPCLFIYGEEDEKYREYGETLAALGWNTAGIKNCGHNTHSSDYEGFKTALLKFITSS